MQSPSERRFHGPSNLTLRRGEDTGGFTYVKLRGGRRAPRQIRHVKLIADSGPLRQIGAGPRGPTPAPRPPAPVGPFRRAPLVAFTSN